MTNTPRRNGSRRRTIASGDNNLSPVYFLSFELEKVLCFKDRQILDLSDGNGCPAQWTVILGNNGVGKTTLLRCLASFEVIKVPTFNEDLNVVEELLFPIIAGLGESKDVAMWKELEVIHNNFAKLNAKLASNNILLSCSSDEDTYNGEQKNFENADLSIDFEFGTINVESNGSSGLICYGYGATRRLGSSSLSESYGSQNSSTLFSEDASLINAEEWLLQTDYAARSASGKTRDRLQKQLAQIIEILKRILPEVEDIRIAPADEENPRPRAEFLTPYGWVHLSSLGLGYRTAIAWMVDLAVRLFQRYPNSEDPLAEPAIVLVDEIDLHLHPKWQRNIMSFLTERFPNTQFIVTAHSPLVVQAAQNANIVLLRREGDRVVIDNNPEIVDNWRVDQVLTSVFELPTARPASLEPLLSRRQELLSKARLTKADKAELKELEEKIGPLPTAETPDDIKAMDIIRWAAQLLENS